MSVKLAGVLLSLIAVVSSTYVLTRNHRPDPVADPVGYSKWADAQAYEQAVRLTADQLQSLYATPTERWRSSKGNISWQTGTIHERVLGAIDTDCPPALRVFMHSGDPNDLPTAEDLALTTLGRNSEGQLRVLNADSLIHCLVQPRDEQHRGPAVHWKLVKAQ